MTRSEIGSCLLHLPHRSSELRVIFKSPQTQLIAEWRAVFIPSRNQTRVPREKASEKRKKPAFENSKLKQRLLCFWTNRGAGQKPRKERKETALAMFQEPEKTGQNRNLFSYAEVRFCNPGTYQLVDDEAAWRGEVASRYSCNVHAKLKK